jgi:hypothetical protein
MNKVFLEPLYTEEDKKYLLSLPEDEALKELEETAGFIDKDTSVGSPTIDDQAMTEEEYLANYSTSEDTADYDSEDTADDTTSYPSIDSSDIDKRILELRGLLKSPETTSRAQSIIEGILPAVIGGLMGGTELSQAGGTLGGNLISENIKERKALEADEIKRAQEELRELLKFKQQGARDLKKEIKQDARREEDKEYREELLKYRKESNDINREIASNNKKSELQSNVKKEAEELFGKAPNYVDLVKVRPTKVSPKTESVLAYTEPVLQAAYRLKSALRSGNDDAINAALSELAGKVKERENYGAALTATELAFLRPIFPSLTVEEALKTLNPGQITNAFSAFLMGQDREKKLNSFINAAKDTYKGAGRQAGYWDGTEEGANALGLKKSTRGKYEISPLNSDFIYRIDQFLGAGSKGVEVAKDQIEIDLSLLSNNRERMKYLLRNKFAAESYNKPQIIGLLRPYIEQYKELLMAEKEDARQEEF